MTENTKRRLEEAKRDGADRIYGWQLERRDLGASIYALRAVDSNGRVYFQREMHQQPYFDAVKHWMSLGTPNQSMLPEGEQEETHAAAAIA